MHEEFMLLPAKYSCRFASVDGPSIKDISRKGGMDVHSAVVLEGDQVFVEQRVDVR